MTPTRLSGPDIRLNEGCVVTAGKFESIHLGHQGLIAKTRQLAAQYGVPSAVLTFNPHPRRMLGDASYLPLFTPDERAYILGALGVDYVLEYPFDAKFATISPAAFCQLLFTALQARAVVVGEHYRFGYQRAGTVETLVQTARTYGTQVHVMPHQSEAMTAHRSVFCQSTDDLSMVLIEPSVIEPSMVEPSMVEPSMIESSMIEPSMVPAEPCSSNAPKISTSVIRDRISHRRMEDAARMLGFAFFIRDRVRHGKQIGRTLGFPTVNIRPDSMKFLPPDGVYVTRTRHGEQVYNSVTNVGLRPTIRHQHAEITVESFLLDFNGDLYGAEVVTEFITFLRPERRFESLDALRAQIALDITAI